MLANSKAYSGFSVNDVDAARAFYADSLGLDVEPGGPGLILHLTGGTDVLIYGKDDHQPATFTILNFPVDDIDATVDALAAKGVEMIRYPGMDSDARGVFHGAAQNMGPDIAWFSDPAGNILSVMSDYIGFEPL